MKQFTRKVREGGAAIGAAAAIAVAGFGIVAYNLGMQSFFAPKFEDLRRKTFENSQSYNDGMVQQLSSYYLEYQKADESQKQALRSVIAHQYANFPVDRLPAHLRAFLSSTLTVVTP